MIRLGLWGARADRRGLAIQSSEFARHMKPIKTMGFDVRGVRSSKQPLDWSDFDQSTLTIERYTKVGKHLAQSWMEGLDVVWGCETFYRDPFAAWANEMGVKTILHCNPEFYRHDLDKKVARPTLELAPSSWRLDQMSGVNTVLPCPVPLDRLPFVQRPLSAPVTFLHVVGVKAEHDRNGSECILKALQHVRHPCRLLVRAQDETTFRTRKVGQVTVEVIKQDIPHYWDLYSEGDVLLLPRRYGGQCLPIQEAAACGIPSVMTDISPQNDWPVYPIPSTGHRMWTTQGGPVEVHQPDPMALARAMDTMSADPGYVAGLSIQARAWAERRSWLALESAYRATIAAAVSGRAPDVPA